MQTPQCFYYITHKDNLESILKHGILSRSQANSWRNKIFSFMERTSQIKSIHNEDVLNIRKRKTVNNCSLWEYANVYFHVRNPMLYSVTKNHPIENIIVLQINADIITELNDVIITDGNAASQETQFFTNVNEGLNAIDHQLFKKEFWDGESKRKIMAEVLVYNTIPKEKIISIYTANKYIVNEIEQQIKPSIEIIPNSKMFFLPDYESKISKYITLKKGDMFFSDKQTFTISVNTVGVMGKGLASRAKYQFPKVYVLYQDLCRQKKLTMGVPYLYKSEENFIRTLMEDSSMNVIKNGNRWFLLFPTKNHWKTNSPINGIEQGMVWLMDNYQNLGISSIALPALGCGLGGLNWREVGPLICKYLNRISIPIDIYLPLEGAIPPEQLTPDFLLNAGLY